MMTKKFVSTADDPIPVSRIDIEWLVTENRRLKVDLIRATEANKRLNAEWFRQREEIRSLKEKVHQKEVEIERILL